MVCNRMNSGPAPFSRSERLGPLPVNRQGQDRNLSAADVSEGVSGRRGPRGLVEPLGLVTGQDMAVSLGIESRAGYVIGSAGPKGGGGSRDGVIWSALETGNA